MNKPFSVLIEEAEGILTRDYSSFPNAQASAGVGLAVCALARAVQNVAVVLNELKDDLILELSRRG